MSVAELKELVHQRIDEVEDENVLEEVIRLLNQGDGELHEPDMIYFTEEGRKEIEEADAAIDRGEFYTHEAFLSLMKERLDRHKDGK